MKHLNRQSFFIVLAAGLAIAAFQNCSKNGFNSVTSASIAELNSLREGEVPMPPPVPLVATLSINMAGPNTLLSQSGIQTVQENDLLTNFKEYVPQYPLYSDGAAKRRWIYLPAGTTINTSNPDEWVYPKGTILWKEFSFGGKKIETRMWEKTGDGPGITNWRPSVYAWKADQTDAVLYSGDFYAKPVDEQMQYAAYNVNTQYKVLNTAKCIQCHSSAVDVVNGFNYLQLSDSTKKINLNTVKNLNWLTNPPLTMDEIKGSPAAKAAIGYIQSNCATCHNGVIQARNYKHRSNVLSYENENIIVELSKSQPTTMPLITFGDPAKSLIAVRQVNRSMPPIGLFVSDPEGQRLIANWINDPESVPGAPSVGPVVQPMPAPTTPVVNQPAPAPAPAPPGNQTSPGPAPAPAPAPAPNDPPSSGIDDATPGTADCQAPALNSMCMAPGGGGGSFLTSSSTARTATQCKLYCEGELSKRGYSAGNYCCGYIPAEDTNNNQSICAVTQMGWVVTPVSGGNPVARICVKN